MSKNKNFNELFDRTRSSAEILKAKEEKDKIQVEDIQSWGEFFTGVFPDALANPIGASCIMRWHMMPYHPMNPAKIEIHLPILTIIEDSSGEIWLAYLTNPSEIHWKFLLLKPNRDVLIRYLLGEVSLFSVYKTTPTFYICTPDIERVLIEIKPKDLPSEFIPAEDAIYDNNIWFDQGDLYYGMNVAPYSRIVEYAKTGRFYFY